MGEPAEQLIRLLEASDHGDELALDQLIELVYSELRGLAAAQLRLERPDHTLQPTALVHEVYLKLFEQQDVQWHNRLHFFRVAAHQIRRVLVDHSRKRNRDKRYGQRQRVTLANVADAGDAEIDLLALDQALNKLDEAVRRFTAGGGTEILQRAHRGRDRRGARRLRPHCPPALDLRPGLAAPGAEGRRHHRRCLMTSGWNG